MTVGDWHAMLVSQSGRCACCSDPMVAPCIDHDHAHCPGETGCPECVRGMLCQACNFMIGHAADDPNRLTAGVVYLLGPLQ